MAQLGDLIVSGKARFLNKISGNIDSADKVNNKLTLTVSGNGVVSHEYDGSSPVSVFIGGVTPAEHTHGNIQNFGTLQTNDITIASGDKLVVTDSSDSSKVARTSISFDGSTATQCLTKKGTWATFGTSNLTIGTTSTTAMAGNTNVNNVTQTATDSTNATYELLFSGTDDNTTRTEGVRKTQYLNFNPSTHILSTYDSSCATMLMPNAHYTTDTATMSKIAAIGINNGSAMMQLSDSNGGLGISTTDIGLMGTNNTWDGTNASLKDAIAVAKGTVTQTPTDSTNSTYELLFSGTADNTEHTESTKKSQYATFNPFAKAFTFGTRKSDSTVGQYSFAEGYNVVASSQLSHAEGEYTVASGICSHAEGYYTTANHESQHVFGEYNVLDASTAGSNSRGNYVEIVGNGTGDSVRSNARTLDWNGNEWLAGKLTIKGSSIAYQGTANTIDMIRFVSSSDIYGHEIAIGGGGATIIGGGESPTVMMEQVNAGDERMYIGNDSDVHIFTNLQNGWANRKQFSFMSNGNLSVPGASVGVYNSNVALSYTNDNNGVTSTQYALYNALDANGKRFGYVQVSADANGNTNMTIRSSNFKKGASSGTVDNSLVLTTSKAGAYTYAVSNATNFRSAIGAAASSSINTKENIKDLTEEEALKLLEIHPVSFDYKQGFDIDNKYERNYGVIAEETVDIIPSVVNVPTTEGYEFDETKGTNQELITVDYAKFIPYLIKLVQMQQQEIDELKNR